MATFTSASLAAPPTRRVSQRAVRTITSLLIAIGALIGLLWLWSATVRDEPVLIIAREVAAGQLIAEVDLARSSGRLPAETRARAIPAERAASLIGQPAAHHLVPGDVLTASSVMTVPRPAAGQVAVAVGLKPELTPPIGAGSWVDVISLGRAGSFAGLAPAAGAALVSGEGGPVLVRGAIVQSVTYAATNLAAVGPLSAPPTADSRAGRPVGGVVLLVAEGKAGPVLAAAAGAGVALALRPGDEASPSTGSTPAAPGGRP